MSLTEAAPHLRAWPVSDGYAKYMSDHEASVYGFLEEYRADLEFASPSIQTPELIRRNTFTGVGVTSRAGEFPTPTLERIFDGAYLQASSHIDTLLSALQHTREVLPVEKAPLSDDYEVIPGSRESSGAVYLQQACGQIGSSSKRRVLLDKAQEMILSTHQDIINMPQYFTNRDPNPTNIRIDTATGAPAVTIIDWENAGISREGYDEARIYTYLALDGDLQEQLATRIDERSEETKRYFWRTVVVRALREVTSIKTGRYEALLGIDNVTSTEHRSLKAKIIQRLVQAAQRGIDELT